MIGFFDMIKCKDEVICSRAKMLDYLALIPICTVRRIVVAVLLFSSYSNSMAQVVSD